MDGTFGGYSYFTPQPEDEQPVTEPRPEPEPPKKAKRLVATKNCRIPLDGITVVLKRGVEIHGLTRQERTRLIEMGLAE